MPPSRILTGPGEKKTNTGSTSEGKLQPKSGSPRLKKGLKLAGAIGKHPGFGSEPEGIPE